VAAERGPRVRRSALLAWALVAVAVVLHVFAHLFVILGIGVGTPGDADVSAGGVGFLVAFYAFPLVGVVIATRRPGQRMRRGIVCVVAQREHRFKPGGIRFQRFEALHDFGWRNSFANGEAGQEPPLV